LKHLARKELPCSPKLDPVVLRVSTAQELGKEAHDEAEETRPEQIIRKLRDADRMLSEGQTIGEVCRQLEVVEATLHRWRNQYGGMKANDAKQLKELEIENGRLKKLVAEQALDKQILEETLKGEW